MATSVRPSEAGKVEPKRFQCDKLPGTHESDGMSVISVSSLSDSEAASPDVVPSNVATTTSVEAVAESFSQPVVEPSKKRPRHEAASCPDIQGCIQPCIPDEVLASCKPKECPVVIELFAGSGRVTAHLKHIGIKAAFGVDHKLVSKIAPIKVCDLTTKTGQKLCFEWCNSPLLAGVFIAPPCGTCSLARAIIIRDSKGRRLPGPVPLREVLHSPMGCLS